MTPGLIDDAVSLRFHLMRSMREGPYDMPASAGLLGTMRRSIWLVAVVVVCAVLAGITATADIYAAALVFCVPVGVAWHLDRRHRRMIANIERPSIWQNAAYETVRHVTRDPYGTDGHEVLAAVLRTRTSTRAMTPRQVAELLYLAGIVTLRSRILVLSYLQLMLLAQAERLRVDAIYNSDSMADEDVASVRAALRRMPHRGRRPVSLDIPVQMQRRFD